MASVVVPSVQRAAVVTQYGGPAKFREFLTLATDKPVPRPGQGEVLVRLTARCVNPADGLCAMGLYPGFAPASVLPATLGLEGMGHVAAAAQDVAQLTVGQRVVPFLGFGYARKGEGSWQEYVAVRAEHVVPLPDSIPDELGCQLAINPCTALGLLRVLNIPRGEFLLQTQAGGAVGRMLIGLSRARGIKTINVVRRAETAPELLALGADHVISSTDEDVTKRVLEITGGKGAYAAVDSVAGELTGKVVSAVRDGGTVIVLGGASAPTCTLGVLDVIFRGIQVKGFWVSEYVTGLSAEELKAFFSEALDALQKGEVQSPVEKTFELAEFLEALKAQQAEGRLGKVILQG